MMKTLTLSISQVIAVLLNFSVQIILAKLYGKDDTGVYFSIIALMNILSVVGLFGINKYYIYIKSKDGFLSQDLVVNIYRIYLIMNIASLVLLFLIGFVYYEKYFTFILSSAFLMIVTNSIAIITSIIQIEGKINQVSLLQIIIPFLKVAGLIGGTLIIRKYFVGYSIIIICMSILILVITIHKSIKYVSIYKGKCNIDIGMLKSTFISLVPYALLSITFLLYTQGNTFYIGVLLDPKSAAYFGLAYLFLNTIFIFPTAIYQKILAHKLINLLYNDFYEFKKIFKNLQELLILSSSILILLTYISAHLLITKFFGDSYLKSVYILQVLSMIIPFRLLTISIGTVLSNDNYIKQRINAELMVTIFNVVSNFLFIKIFGINGAVISVILTEILLSLSFAKVVRKNFKISFNYLFYSPLILLLIVILSNLPSYFEFFLEILVFLLLIKPILKRVKKL